MHDMLIEIFFCIKMVQIQSLANILKIFGMIALNYLLAAVERTIRISPYESL